jgi:arsenate reductase
MAKVDVDLRSEFSKPLTDEVLHGCDVVITLSSADQRRRRENLRREHWVLDNPTRQPADVVDEIRDDVRTRVELLRATLGGQ